MDYFRIKSFEIRNRLFVGTGKYASYEIMQQALEASGCQVVTVAVRRERLVDKQGRSLLDFLDLRGECEPREIRSAIPRHGTECLWSPVHR